MSILIENGKNTELLQYIVRQTENGKGVFTTTDIAAGSILAKISGTKINFEDSNNLEKESYSLQVDLDSYIVPHYPFFLLNHSCNPNCGINHNQELVTIKDIKKGQELTWDYSTSMLERRWTMQCNCKSNNCRKMITDFDLLPVELQEKYKNEGTVMPFINRFFELLKKINNKHYF